MTVIVKVASTSKSGASGASRYLSEREFDPERESRETRQLFSSREDNLTPYRADRFLAGDADQLNIEDLHQLIISMLPEEFERLGDNDLERVAVVREVTREALDKLSAQDLNEKEFRWIAVVHLHTKLPHVQLLLHKELTDPRTGEKELLKRFPKELLANRGSTLDDADPSSLGKISQRFKESLDEHSKPFRHVEIKGVEGVVIASREVIDATAAREHKPTPEEVMVGRWIAAEANAAHLKNEGVSPPSSLRKYVEALDQRSLAQGQPQVPAFLSREQISELTRHRTSELQITFKTMPHELLTERERPYKERPHIDLGRGELERQSPQRTSSPEGKDVQQVRASKDAPIGEEFALTKVDKEKATHISPRTSAVRSTAEASFKQQKLKAQEELFESRGRVLIRQYLALSTNPSQAKEFERAAKSHMEAGRHVDLLLKNYRHMYKEDAPAGAILSGEDKEHLVKNVPRLRHAPGSIRNEFLRDVSAAKTSEQARSYLPKEPRKFQERRPARDKKGGRGR
jgi:hypothetical protein